MASSRSAQYVFSVCAAVALAACSSSDSYVPDSAPQPVPESIPQAPPDSLPQGQPVSVPPSEPESQPESGLPAQPESIAQPEQTLPSSPQATPKRSGAQEVATTGPVVYISDAAHRLWTVNIDAKTIHLVGNLRVPITDLGFDPVNHALYGVSSTGFYRINTTTSHATFIGSLGISNARALVFAAAGRGYTKGHLDTNLYTINNIATGRVTKIGSTSPWKSAGDLTFYNGSLVLSGYTGTYNPADRDSLVFISRTTGAVSSVRATNLKLLSGLVATAPGALYGFSNTSLYRLFPNESTVAGRSVLLKNFASSGVGQISGAAYNGYYQ
jgi:hypothetical protein